MPHVDTISLTYATQTNDVLIRKATESIDELAAICNLLGARKLNQQERDEVRSAVRHIQELEGLVSDFRQNGECTDQPYA